MATLKQLLDQLRLDLDDEDYEDERSLWSTSELASYLSRAESEACLRAKFLTDSETPDICEVRLIPNVHTYDLDCRVMWIRRAKVDGQAQPLRLTSHSDMDDAHCPGWGAQGAGWGAQTALSPTHYLTDMHQDSFRVFPTPTLAQTLNLTVQRLPLREFSASNLEQSPEIPLAHHWNLLEWAKHLAYSKHDADAMDVEAAARHAQLFAALFGERTDAQNMEHLRTKRPMRVRNRFF